jgi:hypothetical protein
MRRSRSFSVLLLTAALGLASAGAPTPAIAETTAPVIAEICLVDHTVHPTNNSIIGCIDVKESNLPRIVKTYSIDVKPAVWPETSIYTRLCNMRGGSGECVTIKRLAFQEIFNKYSIKKE